MNLVANTLCEGCDKRAELEDEKTDLEVKLEEKDLEYRELEGYVEKVEIERDQWKAQYEQYEDVIKEIRELI